MFIDINDNVDVDVNVDIIMSNYATSIMLIMSMRKRKCYLQNKTKDVISNIIIR